METKLKLSVEEVNALLRVIQIDPAAKQYDLTAKRKIRSFFAPTDKDIDDYQELVKKTQKDCEVKDKDDKVVGLDNDKMNKLLLPIFKKEKEYTFDSNAATFVQDIFKDHKGFEGIADTVVISLADKFGIKD